MKVTITPTRLEGQIRIPSSKSMTHREIIASALAHGESRLTGVSWSQDIEATVRILSLLGASIQRQEGTGKTGDGSCGRIRIHTPFPYPAGTRFGQ